MQRRLKSRGRRLNKQLARRRPDSPAVLPLIFRRPVVSDDIRAAASFTLQRVGE